jgi:hypothetical protein
MFFFSPCTHFLDLLGRTENRRAKKNNLFVFSICFSSWMYTRVPESLGEYVCVRFIGGISDIIYEAFYRKNIQQVSHLRLKLSRKRTFFICTHTLFSLVYITCVFNLKEKKFQIKLLWLMFGNLHAT